MSEIVVSYGDISAVAAQVMATQRQINGELDSLAALLAPIAANWQGEAATDYQAAKRAWDAAAGGLNQVLGRIGAALEQTNVGYQQVERANAARWT